MSNIFDVKQLRKKALESDAVINDTIYVSDWDAHYPVQSLRARDLKEVFQKSKNANGKTDEIRLMCLAVLHGCRTPEGERIFTDEDLAKFETELAARPIMEIGAKIMEISGTSEKDVNSAKKS